MSVESHSLPRDNASWNKKEIVEILFNGIWMNVGRGVHWGWISVDTISKAFGSCFRAQKELVGGGGLEKEKCKFFYCNLWLKKSCKEH